MVIKSVSQKSDIIGAFISGLCLIHCLATPLLFLAKSCAVADPCCANTPYWWKYFDVFFLLFSFGAVYLSTKNSAQNWMQNALWISWFLLTAIITNEQVQLVKIPESLIYVPTIALVFLHIYNRKYCQCATECTGSES